MPKSAAARAYDDRAVAEMGRPAFVREGEGLSAEIRPTHDPGNAQSLGDAALAVIIGSCRALQDNLRRNPVVGFPGLDETTRRRLVRLNYAVDRFLELPPRRG
jgi:hypothetical protein